METLARLVALLSQPAVVLFAALSVAVVLAFRKRGRAARTLLAIAVAAWLVIAVLPIADWVILPLEERFAAPVTLPDTVHGIVVLGGAENRSLTRLRGVPVVSELERLTAFVSLGRRYRTARLIMSDGVGPDAEPGRVPLPARLFFEAHGFDSTRVELETRAGNTSQNASFSYAMARPEPTQRWVLITSAFHMPRSVGAFRSVGWEVIPYPVDYRADPSRRLLGFEPATSLVDLGLGIREWIALLAYRILGRTSEVFPRPPGTSSTVR